MRGTSDFFVSIRGLQGKNWPVRNVAGNCPLRRILDKRASALRRKRTELWQSMSTAVWARWLAWLQGRTLIMCHKQSQVT